MINAAPSQAKLDRLETIGTLLNRIPDCASIAVEVRKTVLRIREQHERLEKEVDEEINRLKENYGSQIIDVLLANAMPVLEVPAPPPAGLNQQEARVFQEIARIIQWRGKENSLATILLIKLIRGMLQGKPFVSRAELLGTSGKFQTMNPQLHRFKKLLRGSSYTLSPVREGVNQIGWKLEQVESKTPPS